jgi:hypothetical protein
MNTRLSNICFVVTVMSVLTSLGWGQEQSRIITVRAVKHAIAPPLSQIRPIPPRVEELGVRIDEDEDRLLIHTPGSRLTYDSAIQTSADTTLSAGLASLSTSSGINILGLGTGFSGYSIQAAVPDTNGAAGPTQFVEFVNESFAVFNKSNGSVAYGPANGNTLWSVLGAPCSSSTNLDEVAQYDQLANRWVMLMPVFSEPSYLCVAVSTTSDAVNGGWNLYAFEIPVSPSCKCRMSLDYPKLGVWPDGYYMTYNQGYYGSFVGAAACVANRSAMLAGNAATMQCFINSTGSSYGTLLPGDVDGSTPPPVGSPEYFAAFDYNDQSLDLWQFHVDWTTPANSTFTGPTNIPVAAFTEPCGETTTEITYTTGACIPQASTSQGLDSYGDRLMYRLAYRNFGGYASLVANHTVNTGSGTQTGIRWYELRNSGSGFGLYQQGTYAPDANYRWMGSIAMDKAGDIAMGYSTSSSTMAPSLRYTGRLSSDALGTMESEVDILSSGSIAHGSQTNTWHWGDYSSIAIDPSDDCTFWFASEYIPSNGAHWATRIASFSFPACTQSYTLSVSEIGQGTVTSTDGSINCTNGSGICKAVYNSGTSVSLNASPNTGWTFSGWGGACSGGNPCNITVTGNATATATFATVAQSYTLNVAEVGEGTVTSTDGAINCTNGSGTCNAVYAAGSAVTLNGTGASNWKFSSWGGACTGSNPCNLVMNGNVTATANFTADWAIVNSASNYGNPLTSLTIPATGSKNMIIVALMFNGTTSVSSVTDNLGNTYVSAGAHGVKGALSSEIWYAASSIPGATSITPTFLGTPNHVEITEWEVSGLSTAAPDAKAVAGGLITANNTPGPAVTTKLTGDFVVSVMFASSTNLTAITSGNEFTDDFKTDGNGWAHLTSNTAAVGTHQASWYTASPAGGFCASTVAFQPSN